MGNICGIDIFEQLFAKYGDLLVKFIVGEKTKQHLADKTQQGKKGVSKKIAEIKANLFSDIDKQQGKVNQLVQQNKQKLTKGIPGNFGGDAAKLFGVDSIMAKFNNMKKDADGKFGQAEKQIHSQMDLTKTQACQEITKQQPQIPGWGLLSDDQKKQVMKKGQQKFGEQIQKSKGDAFSSFKDKLSPQSYISKLNNIMPTGSASGITSEAKSKIEMALKAANGGGFLGNVF